MRQCGCAPAPALAVRGRQRKGEGDGVGAHPHPHLAAREMAGRGRRGPRRAREGGCGHAGGKRGRQCRRDWDRLGTARLQERNDGKGVS